MASSPKYFLHLFFNEVITLSSFAFLSGWNSIFIIGILLGMITSIPELITFFESQKYYKKRKNQMPGVVEATNNLFVSNILNLFVIQSIGIIIFAFCNFWRIKFTKLYWLLIVQNV